MRNLQGRPDLLSMNTATFGYQQPINKTIELLQRYNIGGIAPWRREVEAFGAKQVAKLIDNAGLTVTGYCRTSYFPSASQQARDASIKDNLNALEDAATIGAQSYVAVVGSIDQHGIDIKTAREMVLDGLMQMAKRAQSLGVPIALEPLHPMYCGDRSALVTLAQAKQWCDIINSVYPGAVGIAADVYHLWWDPNLELELANAGGDILAYHVSDWLVPTTDFLTDRGMMGDGVIHLPQIRQWIEEAGYQGLVEVEIFSEQNWWKRSPEETLRTCLDRFETCI